jgi:carboxylesterase
MIHNPHLDGSPFLWAGGPVGVLLSHGYTATTAEVRPLGRILHEHGFSVAGPLLPGHGTRPEAANRYRWQDWAAAVEAGYQDLRSRCEKVIVGGESTGALLALYLAGRHPEVAAVLCYAPALQLIVRPFDVLRLYLVAPFIPYVPKGSLDASQNWQGYPVNPLKGAIQLLRLQKVVRKSLPSLRQPVLLVQGKLDTTVHPAAPQIIYDQVASRSKELYWMEHSSHVVLLDREMDEIAEITLRFIERWVLNE